jgi:hypothetical protein
MKISYLIQNIFMAYTEKKTGTQTINSGLPGFGAFFIVRYYKEHNFSEIGSVSIHR